MSIVALMVGAVFLNAFIDYQVSSLSDLHEKVVD